MEPIVVSPRVVVPAHAIRFDAVRAGGPGGQNVNKVATKVELRIDVDAIEGLTPAQHRRLRALAKHRLGEGGELLVTSQRTRNQSRNLDDAREKVRTLVARALIRPKPRIATKPSRGARERRLKEKARRSEKKQRRRWSAGD